MGVFAARNALIAAAVPLSSIEAVPLPVTVTPAPLTAASVPEDTDNVVRMALAAESTSTTPKPVKTSGVPTLAVYDTGMAFTGASFTPVTVTFTVPVSRTPPD